MRKAGCCEEVGWVYVEEALRIARLAHRERRRQIDLDEVRLTDDATRPLAVIPIE
jgi:hypothetical protein